MLWMWDSSTGTPLAPHVVPRRHQQGVEKQQPCERYDKLTLRMANAIVDRSKAMYVPMNQFEGDPEFEAAMRETRVGPTTFSLFEQYQGNKGLLEYHSMKIS